MSSPDEVASEYKEVIDWLKIKMQSEPERTSKLIGSYIKLITYAFDKPPKEIDDLINRTDFNYLNEEETKILKFYFGLLQKRLRK
jgi:hypothetical protein